ncbi:MAG TPA: glycosyltransferase family 2 protein [Alphaproteobacteria bacterium]
MGGVSFIATFYNKSLYVPAVLDAIGAQRGIADKEFIFIDDGSTDNTLALLQEGTKNWQNVRIVSQANAGPAIATNNGIALATKDYIKFWDGDDVAHPDTTFLLLQAVEKHQAGFSFCGIDFADFDVSEYFAQKDKFYASLNVSDETHLRSDPMRFILKGPFANPTTLLFKTDLLRQSGGADPDVFIQDYALSLRAAHLSPLVEIPRILSFAFPQVDQRLSSNDSQILHDLNAVLYHYAMGAAVLSRANRRYLGQRAAGRAWKWAQRHNGKTPFSGDFWRFLKSRISPLPLHKDELYQTLLPFRQSGKSIRTKL